MMRFSLIWISGGGEGGLDTCRQSMFGLRVLVELC